MTWTAGDGPGPVLGARATGVPAHPPALPPALTRKHGARGVLFTVIVAVALVAGAAVLALVFVISGRPEAIAIGFVLALLPVGPLVLCFLWLDRYEPEPVRLLVLSFFWGALAATSAALVLQSVDQLARVSDDIVSGAVVAPFTEEATKGVFVLLLLWFRRHVIDGVLDGLVYAGLVGVGFAFTENILYFASAYTGGAGSGPGGIEAATGLFVLRGIFGPFAHPLFTSAIGIGIGLAVTTRRPVVRVLAPVVGYLVAVALHAIWNGSAFLSGGQFFVLTYLFAMVPGFLLVVGIALWVRHREGAMLARALDDLAYRGYLHPSEVPWLARLPARRTARRTAALRGGPAFERLLREYQQQAIELAALHDRVMRGNPPRDSQHRGALMAQRLAALRAHLVVPQVTSTASEHRGGWA
jgi:RsiW-degrading membrane proteinase PrsW (M82 family)